MSARFKKLYFPESQWGGFSAVDGTIAFYSRVNALLSKDAVVLDVGCGRAAFAEDPVVYRRNLRMLKGKVKKVIGIDVQPAGETNPTLDEFRLIAGDGWPVEDESIDLLIADYVLEHIAEPTAFFAEVARVLKPGAYVCMRTPNKWGYAAIMTRLIPNRWHAAITAKVQENRKEEDVFPTCFKANTVGSIRKLCAAQGMEVTVIGHSAEPAYLSFSRITYVLGLWLERTAPRSLRRTLFVFGQKR